MDVLVDQGIIRKSCSQLSSPIIPVRKPNGKIRICVDLRKLNSYNQGLQLLHAHVGGNCEEGETLPSDF